MRRAAVIALLLSAIGATAWVATRPVVVEVPPGTSIDAAVAGAPDHARLRLLPGPHASFELDRGLTVEAAPGAIVSGPIVVTADGARLLGVRVSGGESGVSIRNAVGVVLEDVTVTGAELHGIEVSGGTAHVRGCRIGGLTSPYAQGFEARNSTGLGHTIVEGCTIAGGQEAIVSHVAHIEIRGNTVTGASQRAIAVTEMSQGLVEDNVVRDVLGSALYCGDESHCAFADNSVVGVGPNPGGGEWQAGYGVVGIYHSVMRLDGNRFAGLASAEPIRLTLGATTTRNDPLPSWPDGWRGAVPGLWVSTIALAGLAFVGAAIAPLSRRRERTLSSAGVPPTRVAPPMLSAAVLGGLAVQSFHMLEHGVQVFQVYVAEGETRSGLLGSAVDTEWVHFVYNVAVFGFMAVVATLLWQGRFGSRGLGVGGTALLAATLIQGYHLAEHVTKLLQHLARGLDPAPGLIGARLGLVWFHFGINLAVYAGYLVGTIALARAGTLGSAWSAAPPARGRLRAADA